MPMRPTLLALCGTLALFAFGAGCASESGDRSTSPPQLDPRAEARAALAEARAALGAGDPREAMMQLDEALSLEGPEAIEVQFLRGECALRMGIEDGNPFFFEDARAAFLEAAASGQAPSASSGAARATWMLHFQSGDVAQLEEALAQAQSAVDGARVVSPYASWLAISPERTLAEIRFSAYTSARGGALPEERAPELFEATRDALEAVIGIEKTESWGWVQLTNLYLWEGRREDARKTIATGLELAPEEVTVHETFSRLAQEDGGWAEVRALYEEFVLQHDGVAIGHWWLGRALYEVTLARLLAEQGDESDGFALAQDHLRRARELEPEFTESCLGYEVICRDGIGWSQYYAGDFEAAEEAFWSMEELFEGGLRWEVAQQLLSGVQSLAYVVAAYNSEWERALPPEAELPLEEGLPFLVKAARLSDRLYEYDPESWGHANNAGYFNRDLAVQMEARGVALLEVDGPRAVEAFTNAVEHMERSYAAYVQAAALAPNDARTINDTGLILAYYLQRDLEVAIAYFEEAIAVGLPRLEAGIEDEADRTMTREAVGDAFQNLGVVALTLRGDAAAARPHFQKSLEYERAPRLMVTHFYLPLCDAIERGEVEAEQVIAAHYWSELDLVTVRAREQAMSELQAQLASN